MLHVRYDVEGCYGQFARETGTTVFTRHPFVIAGLAVLGSLSLAAGWEFLTLFWFVVLAAQFAFRSTPERVEFRVRNGVLTIDGQSFPLHDSRIYFTDRAVQVLPSGGSSILIPYDSVERPTAQRLAAALDAVRREQGNADDVPAQLNALRQRSLTTPGSTEGG